ncbi:MAG: 2-dehydro-3-deoxygalactonokinase [Amphiplicatus sp.]
MGATQFIAVDWGSTNFRAQLVGENGVVVDEYSEPAGITRIDRAGMIDVMARLRRRWPEPSFILCSGMIGSNVGWLNAPYIECPAKLETLGGELIDTSIGGVSCRIVPGLACRGADGEPDVMRGEEVEIAGLSSLYPHLRRGEAVIGLPGTHTKWVKLVDGVVQSFFTSMSGEVFDRLSESGLLSSMITGEAAAGDVFDRAADQGAATGRGLGRLLFGVRAKVVREWMPASDAASYARGVLIGAEIADAVSIYPTIKTQSRTIIVGNSALCALYARAMERQGVRTEIANKSHAAAAGYCELMEQILEMA